MVEQFGGCWSDKSGAWSFVLERLCRAPSDVSEATSVAWLGRWVLNYESGSKPALRYAPNAAAASSLSNTCIGSTEHPGDIAVKDLSELRITAPKVFDYDGDGRAEFLLRATSSTLEDRRDGIESEEYRIEELLSAGSGKIEPYAPAVKILGTSRLIDIRDVDNDGRPDLLFTYKALPSGLPPHRVAHSLPDGTFALDAAAVIAERDQCANVARLLPVLKSDGKVDHSETETAFACAIVAGEKPADVHKRLKQGCAKNDCGAAVSTLQEIVARQGLK
ncbi:VCBS repeat-containing protein [Pendulispora brunnea]|uniref:VCBS repeat-containing protein n=1 Tax=Pendulispora brunnea TaxID=2905690 RepID=A0ABZ2KQ19_9BACT